MEDLRALVRDGEELLKAGASELGDKGEDLRHQLQATIDRARNAYQRLEDKTIATAKAADKTIRDHPYQAIGIALGAGLLIGVLAMRSR
jgi:ElaB/YqjD/DUF883 family membrane-anchored ribosome-binding protein